MSDSQQLSQMIQQSLSPVNSALNVPNAPPSYVQAVMRQTQFVGGSDHMNPNYNPRYNIMPAIVNHARDRISFMRIRDDATEMTPSEWSNDQGVNRLAADPLGRRMAASEEMAIRTAAKAPGVMRGVFNTAATGIGFTGIGLPASIGIGIAGDVAGGWMDDRMFSKARDLRQSAMMLRGRLTPGTLGSPFGQDASGMMRHDVSQQIATNVFSLAEKDSRFSGKQFVQMTDKMAQLGMLRDVGSSDQLVQRVKDVAKQLKTFAKVANEPDVLEALKQMAQLRNVGIADANISQAASNARAYARMTGLSKDQITASGMGGAQIFQQMGLSTGAGYQLGMANRALATVGQGAFSRGTINKFGGASGIGNMMTAGIGAAQQHQTAAMMMHGIFKSTGKGQFELDTNALNSVMSGGMSLTDAYNNRLGQLQKSGNVLQHVQDFQERLPELREAMQQRLGAAGMQMFTIRQAQAMQQTAGGKMTLYSALRNLTGNEDQARVLARIATTPKATQQLMTQMKFENRRRALAQRQEIEYDASFGTRMRKKARSYFGNFLWNKDLAGFTSRRQQEITSRASGVYGADSSADNYLQMNPMQRAAAIENLAKGTGAQGEYGKYGVEGLDSSHGKMSWKSPLAALSERTFGGGTLDRMAMEFTGDDYTGGRLFRGIRRWATGKRAVASAIATAGVSLAVMPYAYIYGDRKRDQMSKQQLAARAVESGRVGRMIFTGQEKSLSDAALQDIEDRKKFAQTTGVTTGMLNRVMRGTAEDTKKRLKSLQSTLFNHGKWDVVESREYMLKRLKLQGASTEQIAKARETLYNHKDGDRLMSSMMRTMLASETGSNQAKFRSQIGEHIQLGGQSFNKMQEDVRKQIEGSFTLRPTWYSTIPDDMDAAAVSEFTGFLGKLGIKTTEEQSSVLQYTQILAKRENGDLSASEVVEQLGALTEGKTPAEKERLKSLFKLTGNRFAGLKEKKEISKHLGSKQIDAKQLGKKLAPLLGKMHTIAMDKVFRSTLEDKFSIKLDDKKSGIVALSEKFGKDKSFRKEVQKTDSKLYDALNAMRAATDNKSQVEARKDVMDYVVKGKKPGTTGVTTVATEGTTGSARLQMQMARSLNDFAGANARNTAAMGTMVDDMAKIIGKTSDGATLGSVVTTFKDAVDTFALRVKVKGG